MTRKQFESLPNREWDEDIGLFNSFVILPTRRKHCSGYGIMDFVACRGMKPVCRLSGCTDDLNLIKGNRWNMDMLFKSKLLHIWCRNKMKCDEALSSMDIEQIKD